ncbi:MAG: hypothetical protein ACFFC7_03075 [Candidatus Hermodarchaeota archaeon]
MKGKVPKPPPELEDDVREIFRDEPGSAGLRFARLVFNCLQEPIDGHTLFKMAINLLVPELEATDWDRNQQTEFFEIFTLSFYKLYRDMRDSIDKILRKLEKDK